MFLRFPEDAQWNAEREAVEFGVGIGEYEGVVRVSRHVFRRFIDGAVTPERCLEAYQLQRTSFRGYRRAQIAPAAADRGRQCRDHRARFVGGRCEIGDD